MLIFSVFLVVILGVVFGDEQVHFEGDKVFSLQPRNEEELLAMHNWIQSMGDKLDVWKEASHLNSSIDIHVNVADVKKVEKTLQIYNWKYSVMIDNLEKIIEEESRSNYNFGYAGFYNYYAYNRYNTIISELRRLANVHPNAETFSVGKSYEGRDMMGLKITDGSQSRKQAVWIDGGIHAREWISPATVMFTIKQEKDMLQGVDVKVQLLEPSETGIKQKVQNALSNYDFYILPVFNVDGYEYSHTRDRMWRKTRSRGARSHCYGADPNRNWDADFGGVGTSRNECSDIYHGTHAFSEIEVKNVASFTSRLQSSSGIKTYWTLHSYSELLLYPWGGRRTATPDDRDLEKGISQDVGVKNQANVGRVFQNSARKRYRTYFQVGQPSRILYSATGGTMDWVYGTLKVKYVYCPELRPGRGSRYGFSLPARYIRPSGLEFVDGFFDALSAM